MTLYELTGQMLTLQQMIDDGEDLDAIRDTMEGIDYEIELKADGYAKIMRNIAGDIASLEAEIERLTKKKDTLKQKADALKENLQSSMIKIGKDKFKTQLFSFNIQNNPPRVVIDDYAKIPAEFLIAQEPKIDSRAIKEFLSETDNKKSFFAHLEQGRSLRIR